MARFLKEILLVQAVENNNLEDVKAALQVMTQHLLSGLRTAAYNGSLNIFKLLLTDTRKWAPMRFNSEEWRQILLTVVEQGNTDILSYLLELPMVYQPWKCENELLITAAEKGQAGVVKILLADPRTNPTDQYNEALIQAVFHKKIEVVKLLLADERVDALDQDGHAFKIIATPDIRALLRNWKSSRDMKNSPKRKRGEDHDAFPLSEKKISISAK